MSWPAVIAPKRAFLLCVLIGALVAALVIALRWRSMVESYVTSAAIADAREKLVKRQPYGESFGDDGEAITKELALDWKEWFLAGYLDRRLLLGKLASGTDALEALCVISTYYSSLERVVGDRDQFVTAEIATWCGLVARSSSAKELLVDILVGDLPWFPRCPKDPPEDPHKLVFFTLLFSPPRSVPLYQVIHFDPYEDIEEEWPKHEQQVLGAVGEEEWRSIVRDTSAEREKTRAGALLLLYRHPKPSVFEREARRALGDPSQLVRLAAAGTLAMREIDAGEGILLEGMGHESWEIRFWCIQALAFVGKTTPLLLEQQVKAENDEWLIDILEELQHRARRTRNQ